MKVKCNRIALHEALQLAASIVPSRTPKAILQCAKLQTIDNQLVVTATDNEITINYHVRQVESVQEGASVVPADRLTSILRESNDDVVHLEVENAICQVIGKDSRFRIYGHDPDDYPVTDMDIKDGGFKVKAGELRRIIGQVVFAAARESTRYAINGIFWEPQGKKLRLVATDGRRLAHVEGDLVSGAKEDAKSAIVPVKTMQLIERMLHDAEETVEIVLGENQLKAVTAQAEMTSNLVQGRFPKYSDVIPTGSDRKITVNAAALQSAVKRAALLINEQSRGVKMTFADETLTLSSSTPEAGDAEIRMPVEYKGEEFSIGFNPNYILEMLRVVEEEETVWEFTESSKPGLIRVGRHFLYVIMPVTV
ncbi:MAG: DNA polymerase III subunit beta [Sedimentisphaerales bacterium]|nr:DNA polymerase III subunit beta [Sedimentisphaerales bacterium]